MGLTSIAALGAKFIGPADQFIVDPVMRKRML